MDSGWRLFLRTVVARAYPRLIGQQREKSWLFAETFLPFLALAGYVYVYRAMQAPADFIGFAVMGGAMTAFWLNVIWSMSAQLYWEKDNGNLALYIMAPNSLMAILLGMALGGMIATALRAVVLIVVGMWAFHVSFTISDSISLLVVFLITMTALYGMGMLFASLFLLYGRNMWQINIAMQEPIYFISGFYFPEKTFGAAISLAASIVPMTLGMDAMRQLLFSNGSTIGFLTVRTEILALLVLAVAFITAAKYWLDKMERLAIQEGTLTDRRK
jgi:ABC-2 type transport system permease protein